MTFLACKGPFKGFLIESGNLEAFSKTFFEDCTCPILFEPWRDYHSFPSPS